MQRERERTGKQIEKRAREIRKEREREREREERTRERDWKSMLSDMFFMDSWTRPHVRLAS